MSWLVSFGQIISILVHLSNKHNYTKSYSENGPVFTKSIMKGSKALVLCSDSGRLGKILKSTSVK